MWGIDISHHQAKVNVTSLLGTDVVFVIHKATEGITFQDPQLGRLWTLADAGFLTGTYHFLRPDEPVQEQAEHYKDAIKSLLSPYLHVLAPAVDVEEDPRTHTWPAPDQVRAFVEAILPFVDEHWGKVLVYTSVKGWSDLRTHLADLPVELWVAWWKTSPPPVPYVMWQQGIVEWPGIGECDTNVIPGNLKGLLQVCGKRFRDVGPLLAMRALLKRIAYQSPDVEAYPYGRVTAQTLNVRAGPGLNYPVMRRLPQGAIVRLYEAAGEWWRIGENEWVHGDWIEPVEAF